MRGFLQQRLEKLIKGDLLISSQQIVIQFIIEQKGADADDGSGQVASSFNDLFDLVGPFGDQVFQYFRVDVHVSVLQ